MRAVDVLRKNLVNNFFSWFSVGDTWNLRFDNYYLVTQNVIADDENVLNDWLKSNYKPFDETIDKEYISKCAIVSACMRQLVMNVEVDQLANLTLEFENGQKLLLPSNEDIVDWQWGLNTSGADPYQEYIVACFRQGEMEMME